MTSLPLLDTLCHETFWNGSAFWGTSDPLFSRCFRQTALGILPCLVFLLICLVEVVISLQSTRHPLLRTRRMTIRFSLAGVLSLLQIFQIISVIASNANDIFLHPFNFYAYLVKFLSFSIMIIVFMINKKKGVVTSGSAWLFSLVMSLCSAIEVYHCVRLEEGGLELTFDVLNFLLLVALLISCFFADDPTVSLKDYLHPREVASFPSRLTFWWFTPVAVKGFKAPLTLANLYKLRQEDRTDNIGPLFSKNWKTDPSSCQEKEDPGAGVIRTIFRSCGMYYLVGSFFKFCSDIVQFANPNLLKRLLQYIEGENQQIFQGLIIVASMFTVSMIQSFLTNAQMDRQFITNNRVKSGLTSLIYEKGLKLKHSERKTTTIGEIVNLMSVDSQRVVEIFSFINLLWSAPLQIIISMYFIYQELGYAVFAGVSLMVLLLPINGYIARLSKKMQKKQMKFKDERVKTMNEILNGTKVIKLYAWEESFIQVIGKLRDREIRQLKLMSYLNSFSAFIWTCAPFMVALISFTVFVLSDERNVLTAEKAFVSLAYFNILRFPLNQLPNLINSYVLTMVSVKRLDRYLRAPELDNYVERISYGPAVELRDASFSWDVPTPEKKEEEKLTLRNISASIEKGSLVAVIGSVGSGKSSLMSAILGEMERVTGKVIMGGIESIAYVPQQAWIQNTSLRDNILFGLEHDRNKYDRVIDVCELKPDLEILPAGDETEIGEKGINLSGGQKQRVNLARACYADKDLYLLDDPLSAVDSHVAKNLFDRVISSKTGILRKKTRILVTNNLTILPFVDQILVVKDGTISEKGTYQTLMGNSGDFADFVNQFSNNDNNEDKEDESLQVQRTLSMTERSNSRTASMAIGNESKNDKKKRLIKDERAETGRVKKNVYIQYFKSIRVIWLLLIFSGIILNQGSSAGGSYWLSVWTSDKAITNANGTVVQDVPLRNLRLWIYGLFGFLQAITVFSLGIVQVRGSIDASINIHKRLLYQILRSPMVFFDTTPIGRIVNRFSGDIDAVDYAIPSTFKEWVQCLLSVVTSFLMIAIATPWFMLVILPVGVLYFFIQRFYIPTSRQLRRLGTITRSPIFAHFGETLSGVSTIRAYNACPRFIQKSDVRIDKSQTCTHSNIAANRWLSIRLQFCGNIIVMFAALFAVLYRETIDPGIAGLSLSYAMTVTGNLTWMVHATSQIEINIVSVERILEYCRNVSEAEWTLPVPGLSNLWPEDGRVIFEKYAARYRQGLDLVVKDINLRIEPREKIGIVGRTGAGKSTITLSVFRLIEPADGRIIIDGVDIGSLGLHQLRKRLTIIPQDPVLFSGTLRFNLDPFSEKNDHELWQSLEHAHLKDFVSSLKEGLDHTVSEGGDNLSVGQKQLICLARALLRKTRILILDEATAAVDLETDSLIQSTIREKFSDCTIITIAHRLHTIMDSTRVLVLDQGQVMEFDSPQNLLNKPESLFYSLAKDAGIAS